MPVAWRDKFLPDVFLVATGSTVSFIIGLVKADELFKLPTNFRDFSQPLLSIIVTFLVLLFVIFNDDLEAVSRRVKAVFATIFLAIGLIISIGTYHYLEKNVHQTTCGDEPAILAPWTPSGMLDQKLANGETYPSLLCPPERGSEQRIHSAAIKQGALDRSIIAGGILASQVLLSLAILILLWMAAVRIRER